MGFPEQALPAGRLRRSIVAVWWLYAVQVQKELRQEALDPCASGASRKQTLVWAEGESASIEALHAVAAPEGGRCDMKAGGIWVRQECPGEEMCPGGPRAEVR